MSIETHLASQRNEPPTYKRVMKNLLAEQESEDLRPWKVEEEIGNKEWEGMEKELEEEKKEAQTKGDWRRFVLLASRMHILDPHHPLQIDNEAWKRIDEFLKKRRGDSRFGDWFDFAELASYLHLLSLQPYGPRGYACLMRDRQNPTSSPLF